MQTGMDRRGLFKVSCFEPKQNGDKLIFCRGTGLEYSVTTTKEGYFRSKSITTFQTLGTQLTSSLFDEASFRFISFMNEAFD